MPIDIQSLAYIYQVLMNVRDPSERVRAARECLEIHICKTAMDIKSRRVVADSDD